MSRQADKNVEPDDRGQQRIVVAEAIQRQGIRDTSKSADGFFDEQQPTMRAVTFHADDSLSLRRIVEFGKHEQGNPLSLPSEDESSSFFFSGTGASSGKSHEAFQVHHEWNRVAKPSEWKVDSDKLEVVPFDFPLERTSREVYADASIVADRISNALRELSIEAEFDSENAKAKCKTDDYVVFRVRLFAGDESGQPVVVEIQRRCGSASSFMRSCRALLSAAEGKAVKSDPEPASALLRQKPICQMKCLKALVSNATDATTESTMALEGVIEMLRSSKRDINVLGLENLLCMTDPIKTSATAALQLSKCVALGCGIYDVREEIRVLAQGDDYIPLGDDGDRDSDHREHMHLLSLSVFANAFSVCAKDGCLTEAVRYQDWFKGLFIPSLIEDIKRFSRSSCAAYKAACCLSSLLSCSSVACQAVVSHKDGVGFLRSAQDYGTLRHQLLAVETARCLKSIEEELRAFVRKDNIELRFIWSWN